MKKETLIVFLTIFLFSLSFVSAVEYENKTATISDGIKETPESLSHEDDINHPYIELQKLREQERKEKEEYIGSYKFVEPPDMGKRLSSYRPKNVFCPAELNPTNIRNKIDEVVGHVSSFSDEQINDMLEQCKATGSFRIAAIDTEPEIETCLNSMLSLLKDINISNFNEKDLFIECIKRQYFIDQVKNGTLIEFDEANIGTYLEERNNFILNKFSSNRQLNRPRCENEDCDPSNEKLDLPLGYVCEGNSLDCKTELDKLRSESKNESHFIELLNNNPKIQKTKEIPKVKKTIPTALSRFSKILDILKHLFGFR